MPFPYSSAVVAGTDATSTAENNIRKDGITRWLKFEVLGTLAVGNTQGGSFVMPFAGQVVKTTTICDSGSATVRTKNSNGAVTIESGITVSSSPNEDTSPTNPNFVKNDVLSLDITAVSSGVHLLVMVEVLVTP